MLTQELGGIFLIRRGVSNLRRRLDTYELVEALLDIFRQSKQVVDIADTDSFIVGTRRRGGDTRQTRQESRPREDWGKKRFCLWGEELAGPVAELGAFAEKAN